MQKIIIALLVMTLFVGLLFFTGLAGAATDVAGIFFYIFLALLVVSLLLKALYKFK